MKKLIKSLFTYTKNNRLLIVISILFSCIYSFCLIYTPYIIGQEIINLFKPGFVMNDLVYPLVKLGIVIIIGFTFGMLMGKFFNLITFRIIKNIRMAAFNKILLLPISYLDKHSHGDLLTRLTSDIDQVYEGLLHGFTQIFNGLLVIIITLIFMFITKWEIAIVVVIMTPMNILLSYFISKKSHQVFKERNEINGSMVSFTNEMISNQRTVIAYDLNNENNLKYQEINKKLYKAGFKSQFMVAFLNPATRLTNAIMYAVIALYGMILIVKNPTLMNVGMLSIFLFYASQYSKPFNEISNVASELTNSFACLHRVFELIDEEEINDETNKVNPTINKYEYDIKDLNFAYEKNKTILKNINLKIFANHRIAVVGPTGCGKTTLINLLLRFYDVNEGYINLDNRNLLEYQRDYLRDKIGLLLQDTYLFKGTIKENIAYAKLDSNMDDIIKAAKLANAYDFISKLNNGFDTQVDEDSISAGQKQLICIARLMLLSPSILILDEATSNIDPLSEVQIQKAFFELMKGKTSIVIAHRLSTIKNSDLIVVIKDGSIIEMGNHNELINKNGFYKTLYEAN